MAVHTKGWERRLYLHSSNYLKYLEHARVKLVEQQNVDLLAWMRRGVRGVVANDNINYRHPAKYNDTLAITCRVAEIGESTIRFAYEIVEQRAGKQILDATAMVVTVDSNGRPTSIPSEIREALSRPSR